jgi:predicted nucleic acid-binding Zn ribbon protein
MTSRRSPRPASSAIRAARERAAPRTRLAAVQGAWVEVVGEALAAHAAPTAERGGEITVECSDTVWAQELDLMQDRLLKGLREQLGDQAPDSLRFRVGSDTA